MKKMIVLVSMVVFSLSFFAGCDSKGKKCGQLYDKVTTCSKDVKLLEDMGKAFGTKDKFVSECKKNWKEAEEMTKCAGKGDCKEFAKCLLKMSDEDMKKMEEMQKLADMPADAPADMPADMPAEDMPADMPADAPAADMPADAPAADMPAEPAADMPAEEMK